MFAARYLRQSEIGNDFAAVTEAMDQGLVENHFINVQKAVAANHALLCRIGVVPPTVQSFIENIVARGGAAKICGAGSIVGEKGGVVLVVIQDVTALAELCARYHYTILPIHAEARGVHCV
jgi:mevalonate kinase